MVDLVRSGRNPEDLAKEFEPTAQSIRNWVKQADIDDGRRSDGPTTDQLKRIRTLEARIREIEKENRRIEEEKEILRKAAVFFARETDQRR